MTRAAGLALPEYERPPVIEVVCGIQFEPLAGFQATTPGLFWHSLRDEYPATRDALPLPPVRERPLSEAPESVATDLVAVPCLPRVFLEHREPNWLMQLQRDRLLHNWRKVRQEDQYPRYPAVFDRFWRSWTRWRHFCETEDLGCPSPNQLEITYINHIPAGEAWSRLADLGTVFPDLSWRSGDRFLPEPEAVAWQTTFALPEGLGRLRVSVRHAQRTADGHPVLLCELTARGMPASSDEAAIRNWFGLGREWIVRGFADLVGEKIQRELWNRKA